MTANEFLEIREAWAELMTIYDEIDALNTEETRDAFGAAAAHAASAH